MKYGKLIQIAAATSAVLGTLLAATPLAAQGNTPKHSHYRVVDMGTLGGPQSYFTLSDISYSRVLNKHGSAAGWADTSTPDPYPDFCFAEDCFVAHAFQWNNGIRSDLGTLPGGVSSQPTWISENGLIAGVSENGEIDPLIPGFPELRAVLWNQGKITDLGTLDGGYESQANAVNDRGQVVGAAVNTIPNANSMFGFGYQVRAFLWQDGTMQDLGTLGGTDATALLMNERGQIVGDSYTSSDPSAICSTIGFPLTTGAFLWDKGSMVDLGNFGGTCTFGEDLNNKGQVVGGSLLPGDQVQHPFLWERGFMIDLGTFGGSIGNSVAINDSGTVVGWANYPGDQIFHTFLWKNGKKKDLGTLPGDSDSFVSDINATEQVVGISVPDFDFSRARPFLWEDGGPMVDLNTLIPPNSGLQFATVPPNINDRGEIAIEGTLNGNTHAFVLIPDDDNASAVDATQSSAGLPAVSKARVTPQRVPAFATRPTHHLRGLGPKPTK